MSNDYDVIVLGGGSPGEHCAGALAEGGLRVALAALAVHLMANGAVTGATYDIDGGQQLV